MASHRPERSRAVLLAALLASQAAYSQAGAEVSDKPASAPTGDKEVEELRRELEATRKELKEVREEFRAQLATQSAAQAWEEEWVEEKRKLELFVPDGYFRVRPDLFHKFDLARQPDPSGFPLFPRSPTSELNRTQAGVNMRFRFEPTFNISEEVRLRLQLDALDNVLLGSTPDYAYSRFALVGYPYDRDQFSIFSESQVPPRSGLNALQDSISLKRVYGEVSTPVGILRFGRMGSHWGLGMVRNDGNCPECDFGDHVDRLMFVTEPFTGIYVTPMLELNLEGPSSARQGGGGQPFDLSNEDDAHGYVVAIARRDTEQQARAKLENNLHVLNYGLHFTYRIQRNDPAEFLGQPFQGEGGELKGFGYVPRGGTLYIPDLWAKYERKLFSLELEAAAVLGTIGNRAQTAGEAETTDAAQPINVIQFGGVARGEYRLMEGSLRLRMELGFASGDDAPGFGNFPRRRGASGVSQAGDIDGPQFGCRATGCDDTIRNFRFNRDYRIDLVLWREILGGVTDAIYAKPTLEYKVAEGFHLYASAIYSRSVYAQSTPSSVDPNLGVELNGGARYETEDGFFAAIDWGILFPLGGLGDTRPTAQGTQLDGPAQALRGAVGVRF
ncbi:MAG: TIGR04551 family protein [Myxococcales bacterium]|nr:TIGR04551 family protein [Myxococcales bacterium]